MRDYNLQLEVIEELLERENLNDLNGELNLSEFDEKTKELESSFHSNYKKVLIVEDDPVQIQILQKIISEINPDAEVDWEIDAYRAMKRISNASKQPDGRNYDAVICDIELEHNSNGIEFLNYCKESQIGVEPILISAHPKMILRKKLGGFKGKLDYFKKPLDFVSFYQRLAPLLKAS